MLCCFIQKGSKNNHINTASSLDNNKLASLRKLLAQTPVEHLKSSDSREVVEISSTLSVPEAFKVNFLSLLPCF